MRALSVLMAAGVLCVAAAVLASRLELHASFLALMPEDHPLSRELDEVTRAAGGSAQVVVVWTGEQDLRRSAAKALAGRLRQRPDVLSASARAPVGFFQDRWAHLLDADELAELESELHEAVEGELERSGPFALHLDDMGDPWEPVSAHLDRLAAPFDGTRDSWYEPAHGRATYTFVRPHAPMGQLAEGKVTVQAIHVEAQRLCDSHSGLAYEVSGMLPLALAEEARVGTDATRAVLWAVGLIVLAMVGITRRLSALWVLGVPLTVSLLVTLGVAQLAIGHLNILSAFMVPVLAGLGVDFCIHVYLRHLQLLQDGATPEAAARQATTQTFRPNWVASATSGAAFLCLGLSHSPGVREYALVACVGLASALLAAHVLVPVLARLSYRRAGRAPWSAQLPVPRGLALAVAVTTGALVAASLSPAREVRFFNDFDALAGQSAPAQRYREIARDLGGPVEVTVLLAPDVPSARQVVKALGVLRDAEGDPLPVLSLSALLPADPQHSSATLARMANDLARIDERRVPEERRALYARARRALAATPWSASDLPKSLRQGLTAADSDAQIVLLQRGGVYHTDRQIADWVQRVGRQVDDLRARGVDVRWMDVGRVTTWLVQHMKGELPALLAGAVGAVALLLWLGLGRLRHVAMVLAPVAAAFTITLAALHWTGLELNLYNALVLPSIVGIGVDDAVHLLHAHRPEEGFGMARVWRTRGPGVLLSSFTTAVGFGTMATAQHGGLHSMGVTALVGVGAVLLCTLALAALLWLREPQPAAAEP